MSRGRSGDKTYIKDVPSTDLALRLRGMKHVQWTDVQDRVIGFSPADMRRAIENGQCPFCGKKFKNIAAHTNRTHGVDRNELKDMALIPRTRAACSPEYSETCRERSIREAADNPDHIKNLRPKGNKRNYSVGGKLVQKAKSQAQTEQHFSSLNQPGMPPSARARAAATNSANKRAASAQRDKAMIDRVEAGAMLRDVAAEFGVDTTVVKAAMKHYGKDRDMREVYWSNRPPTPPEQMAAARAACDEKIAAERDRRLARWAELGKTWDAVVTLAREEGVDERHMRFFLRKHGETVPDGRQVSARRFTNRHAKLARWAELGKTWDALVQVAAEFNISQQAMKAFLKQMGEPAPDGRQVSARRFKGSLHPGVRRHGSGFTADVTHNRQYHYLGTFATAEEAAEVARAKRVELGIEG